MAGGTAFDLVLLSGALVALCRGAAGVAQGLAVVALLAPTLALLGYLYGAQALYAAGSVFTIALHTTVALAALSLAVLFRDPHRALMAPLTSETVGGSIARRLIPAVVLVPVLLGWVRLYGQRRGLYDTEFGSALLVEAKIVLLSGMVWLIASSLGRADAQRRRNEEELARMNADLARSNDELEQFAYVASHDLQEPLRAVAGCTQLLARKYEGHLDEQASELIRHSVEGATRMQRQIEDLLTYSRIATRGREIERTSAEEALGKALANLRAAISESGGRVEHGPLPEVRADGTQLTLLFQNLVGNAVKFRAPGRPPAVRVTAEPDPPYVRFTVADDGIGIDPLFFGRIFGVFQRLHTRTEYPGTGIGLAICKRIVERHGGRIWVDSAPGRGSSFHFTLPSGAEK